MKRRWYIKKALLVLVDNQSEERGGKQDDEVSQHQKERGRPDQVRLRECLRSSMSPYFNEELYPRSHMGTEGLLSFPPIVPEQ